MHASDPLVSALIENAPLHAKGEAHLRAAVAEAAALGLACAVEYFHTASLLLDDLPCMDDATLRRGRPCAHRVHGEATAILAALAFINRAHALCGAAFAGSTRDVRLAALACVDACLGPAGLLDGQAHDLRFAESAGGARTVGRIAALKTAGLFQLTLLLPALAGPTTAAEWAALRRVSLYWGLAYQAADDLADVLSAEANAGKTTGRDRIRRRPNLALELGVSPARGRIARLVAQGAGAVARLTTGSARWNFLAEAQARLADRIRQAPLSAAA